ncbi:MAG TPA: hypothetical protein VJZ27_06280, partial [Aggregatilineales bacterium]|nr:hypothetical protein [Aggregatilineales bacterium]
MRPTSLGWTARAYILDNTNQVIAVGEPQPDGSTVLSIYLNTDDPLVYSLLVTGDQSATGSYDVIFDVSQNNQSPVAVEPGVTVTGRLNAIDSADEWLWDGTPE